MFVDIGFNADVANLAFTLFNFGAVLGIYSLGYLASRWPLSALITVFTVVSGGLMCLFAGVAMLGVHEVVLLSLIFVIGYLMQGGFTGMYAVAAKVYPVEIRSTGVGWAIGLGRFGAVLGPALAGLMIASGLSISFNFVVFAVPMVMCGFFAYKLHVR